MNILFVTNTYYPSVGGVEKVTSSLAMELISRGHTVDVITRKHQISLPVFQIIDGVSVHRLPFYVYRSSIKSLAGCLIGTPYASLKLLNLAIKKRPCIVHIHFVYSNALGVYLIHGALKHFGVPIILTFHGSDAIGYPQLIKRKSTSEVRMLNWTASKLLSCADAVTCVSKYSKKKLHDRFQSIAQPIDVIHNGVDEKDFSPKSPEKTENIILAIGHLVYEKGFDILLEAFVKVQKSCPNWKLIFAGDGELRQFLENLAKELKVDGKVTFLGNLKKNDLIKYLRTSAMVVMPSRWEGFALAALEAMACEKPVIMTDFPSAKEMIDDGNNGFIVFRENSKALADAIIKLIENPELRKKAGCNARQQILKKRLTWNKIIDEYVEIYNRF